MIVVGTTMTITRERLGNDFQLSLFHASTGVGGAASSSFTFFSSPFFDQSGFFCKIEKTLREIQLCVKLFELDLHTG